MPPRLGPFLLLEFLPASGGLLTPVRARVPDKTMDIFQVSKVLFGDPIRCQPFFVLRSAEYYPDSKAQHTREFDSIMSA